MGAKKHPVPPYPTPKPWPLPLGRKELSMFFQIMGADYAALSIIVRNLKKN